MARWGVCGCDVLSLHLSLGVPFYRSRGGTRLHNVGARVGLDRGRGASKLEASVPAWARWVLLRCTWRWWRVRFLSWSPVYRLVIVPYICTLSTSLQSLCRELLERWLALLNPSLDRMWRPGGSGGLGGVRIWKRWLLRLEGPSEGTSRWLQRYTFLRILR